ncbi:MAG: gliding motility-associated C-terminal domain-containing protein [Bacteroidales bacterium]
MKKKLLYIFIISLLPFAGIVAQEMVIDSVEITPVTCSGDGDGAITIYISGGLGDLKYTLLTSSFDKLEEVVTNDRFYSFSGYPEGSYWVFVDDTDGSTEPLSKFVTITSPDPIQIQSVNTSDQTCSYLSNGTITVNATGEGGNLHYQLTGTVTDDNTDGLFTGLPEGTYNVEVTDSDGCPSSDNVSNIVISSPPPLTITLDSNTPATCHGGSDGSLEITPGGGTPSGTGTGYTYNWTGPDGYTSNDEDISGLQAGDYDVTVTDANGCDISLGPITVDQPNEIAVPTVSSTNVTCNGGSNGSATITVNGDFPPFSFSWIGQGTGTTRSDQNPSNLIADTYDLTVTDQPGCSNFFEGIVTITEPDPLTVAVENVTDVSCFGGSNGSTDITTSGGTAPYTFSWSGPGSYTSTEEDPTGMPPGTYSVEITDVNGCSENFSELIVITEPDDITAVLDESTDVSCFGGKDGSAQVTVSNGTPGYTYLWTGDITGHTSTEEDPANLIADTYHLQITDANTCAKPFNNIVTINQPDEITASISIVNVDCNGESTGEITVTPSGGTAPYTYVWTGPNGYSATDQNITGLGAGSYDLTITDALGCTKDFNNNIVSENPSITATFIVSDISCNGESDGAISVTVGGGVPPYSFSWSGDNGYSNDSEEDISGLDAGNYTLTVTDALGCIQEFPAQPITDPAPLSASFIPSDVNCFGSDDGAINITVTGGTPGYNYLWSGPGGFSSTEEDISGLEPGNYSVDITDANGCPISYPDIVTIDEPAEIGITATVTDISCNGADDGTITINMSGGTPEYNFSWTGPNGFTSEDQDLSSLEPGTYNLIVTDNNNCNKDFNNVATLTEPDPIVVTFVSQTNLDCNGDNNGTIEIDVAGGTPPYAFSWTNSSGAEVSTDEDPTGLPADTYSLEVTDNVDCAVTYPDAVELTEPPELTTTLSKTDVLCAGESNGTITVTPSGGTPPYEHARFPSGPFTADNTFTGLSNGTYRIYTRDANSCLTSSIIRINEPDLINYEYSISGQNVCHGDSNVVITINNVTGGVQPYEFSIDGGASYQSSSIFPNLPGGSYPVVVRDSNLCEQAIAPLTILEPDSIAIDYYDQTDIFTCYDAAEGSILIMGNGGTGAISYSLNGGTPKELGEFENILGGTYTVSLIDEQLCQKDTLVEILRPDQLIFEKADVTDVTGCPGDNNGEIDANVIGGTGSKEYSIDGMAWQPTGLFTLLTAGDYTVMVRDANGCEEDTTLTVSEPLPLSIISETATPASCFGTPTGAVTVETAGGTLPYLFSLTPPLLPDQDTGTFSGLPAGDYTISVTDAEGCDTITSTILTVTDPPELIVNSVKIEHITCNGSNDGKIDIYIAGGTSPYEYSIDNEATWEANSSFTGLGPGAYEVYVRDVNNCSVFAGSFIITEPSVLDVTAVVTDVTPCFGDSTGAISATATGGWNSYEYSIDGLNYQLPGDFTDLPAGEYTVFVRDSGNCSVSTDEVIAEPEQASAEISKTDYVDDDLGTITISDASGGTPPYEYSIDGFAGTFTSNTSYTDLTAGFYEVVVRDALGCTYEESIQIFDIIPLDMVIDSTGVSCYDFDDGTIEFQPQDGVGTVQYSIDNGATYTTEPLFENLPGDSTYILRAYDEEDKQYSGSVFIPEPDELFAQKSVSPANCNAFSETGSAELTVSGGTGVKSFNWSDGSTGKDLTNVVSGQYFVTITDEAACTIEENVLIPSLVTVNVNAGKDTSVCAGATLNLEGSSAPDNTMHWEPETYLSNPDIYDPIATNITEPITYTYTLTETTSGYGCYNMDTLHIEVLPVYGLEITADTFGLQGQTIQLEVLTTGEYNSYQWVPETGLNMATVPDPVVMIQNSIRYKLFATNDYGCVETDSVFIEVIEDIQVYNAFSPNGDQINDYFEIENAYKFPDILVEVYNRWGARIFSSVGYSDDKRWNGTFNGKDAPTGTYYFVVIPHPDAKPITGNVTIIR